MLALPPYELKDEDIRFSKEEFCLKLADLVAEILECEDRDLEKLEITWKKDGSSTFRTLFKKHEASTHPIGEDRQDRPSPAGAIDRSPDVVGVSAGLL